MARGKLSRRTILGGALASTGAALVHPGSQAAVGAHPAPLISLQEGKTLTIGVFQEPDNLFSIMGNLRVVSDIQSFIWRRIIEFDDQNQPQPVLCEELPSIENGLWVIDDSAGTMAVTFHLKQGITWADGEEITARDVVFAYELMSDEQSQYGPSYLEPIDRIEATDDYTFVVHYAQLFPFANAETFRVNVVPEHFYRPIWEEAKSGGGDYWQRFLGDDRVGITPLSNGPFVVDEWVQGSHLTLVRNPNYNLRDAPKIDQILIRIIPDLNTLAVNVSTGDVQLADGWLTIEQATELEQDADVTVHYVPVSWLEHATLQINEAPLDDKRVRQALLHSIDRVTINDALFNGQQPPADSWLPPQHPAYNPDVRQYPYDPEGALALLAEAGWTADDDGAIRNAAGDQMSLTLVTNAGDQTRQVVAEAIQAEWQALGFQCDIQPQTPRLLFSETLPNAELPAGGVAPWRWVIGYQDAQFANNLWRPREGNLDQLLPDSPWGAIERNIELIDAALAAIDPAERYALLQEQQAIWAEELPVLPLYWWVRVATADVRLQGYAPSGEAMVGWNVEMWDLTDQ